MSSSPMQKILRAAWWYNAAQQPKSYKQPRMDAIYQQSNGTSSPPRWM